MLKMRSLVLAVLALAAVGTFALWAEPEKSAEPGAYHRYVMKGNLLEVEGKEVYLCIGKRDGAAVGQRLDVFRYSRDTTVNPKQGIRYKRTKVGALEIKELVDMHYAKGTAVEGALRVGDMAELEPPED